MGWWTSDFWTMNTGWIIAILHTPNGMTFARNSGWYNIIKVTQNSLRRYYQFDPTVQLGDVLFFQFTKMRHTHTHACCFFGCQIPALQKSQVSRDSWQSHLLTKLFLTQPGGLGGHLVDKSRSLRQVEFLQQVIKGLVSSYGGKPFTREFS